MQGSNTRSGVRVPKDRVEWTLTRNLAPYQIRLFAGSRSRVGQSSFPSFFDFLLLLLRVSTILVF